MSDISASEQIDRLLNRYPSWQKLAAKRIREIIHKAEPNVTEEVKFTDRPYFTYKGNVCALLSTKDHLNVFLYDPIAPDPNGLINQGHDNATARSIQIYENEFPDEQGFINLIKSIVENNKKGGWRKLK